MFNYSENYNSGTRAEVKKPANAAVKSAPYELQYILGSYWKPYVKSRTLSLFTFNADGPPVGVYDRFGD